MNNLVSKLTNWAPRNFTLEWKGDLLSPIRYKTEATKETALLLAQIWANSVTKITNRPHVNLKKYIRINVPHMEDTVTITIHPTATIMLQGKSSYDWADKYMELITKEMDIEIQENKSKLNQANESNISTRSLPIYGVCAICDQVNNEDMVECEHCFSWTHNTCAGFSEEEARKVKYYCKFCKYKYNLLSFFPNELPETSTPKKTEAEKSKNCTKEDMYTSNLLFMQKNLSQMAEEESVEESDRVNELKNLAKSLSENMENALKASNIESTPEKDENLSISSKSSSTTSISDESRQNSFEERPLEQKSAEDLLLNSSNDSISEIDPDEYNLENILKTVRKLQQDKFKYEAEINNLNQKLQLADEIIQITESEGKKPEKHRLYKLTKKEIVIEYMKLEDIIININQKLSNSNEQIKEMTIKWEDLQNNRVEPHVEERVTPIDDDSEIISKEQLKLENEWLLKKTDEAKAEIVNLNKANQIQKYNIAYFQEQLEDLQVANTQLNAMLIMEKEGTETIKAEDLILKETNNKLLNALKKLQNEKTPQTADKNQRILPNPTSDPTNLTCNTLSGPNLPVDYDSTVPPPNYQNPANNEMPQDRRNEIEIQNFYRPVCKDYINGRCFSRTCIYYHPKKVSKSRVQNNKHHGIPSILELNIPYQHNPKNRNVSSQSFQTTNNQQLPHYPNQPVGRSSTQTYTRRNPQLRSQEPRQISDGNYTYNRNHIPYRTNSSTTQRFSNQGNQNILSQRRHEPIQNMQRNYDEYRYDREQPSLETHHAQSNISHPPSNSERNPVCRYFQRGFCRVGNFCRFSHQIPARH